MTDHLAEINSWKLANMSESGIARSLVFFPKEAITEKITGEDHGSAVSALVQRVRGGDQEAFDELYRRYSPMVHGIMLARVPRIEVDDLVQDVFLTVFNKLNSLNNDGAVGGWIASIARRRAADCYRNSRPTEEMPENLGVEPIPLTEANEVLAAIKRLPDAYSETLILRLVEGMTGPEISEITGITHDSVRVNLHRGMKLLKEKLGVGGEI